MRALDDAARTSIAVQDSLADVFEGRYRDLLADPYTSGFAYSRKKIDEIVDAALSTMPQDSRVLDAGCGTGFQVASLRRRGFDVVGLEPAPNLRARACRDNPGVRIDDGVIEAMPYPDASFDAVVSIEVVRHLVDPAVAVAEMARVVRPDGLAVFSAANRWALNGYAAVHSVTSRVDIPGFVKQRQLFHTVAEARRMALDGGFSSAEVHGVVFGPWPVVARAWRQGLPRLLRRFEPVDDWLSQRSRLRGVANHLVVVARR